MLIYMRRGVVFRLPSFLIALNSTMHHSNTHFTPTPIEGTGRPVELG
jgi:hypothetical protein